MSKFPEEMQLVIVEDLYLHYTLGYEVGNKDDVLIYCESCDGVVGVLDWEEIQDTEAMDLYERIIEEHRKTAAP